MKNCITAEIKNGKLYMRTKKTKSCRKKVQTAQEIIDSVPTRRIIVK